MVKKRLSHKKKMSKEIIIYYPFLVELEVYYYCQQSLCGAMNYLYFSTKFSSVINYRNTDETNFAKGLESPLMLKESQAPFGSKRRSTTKERFYQGFLYLCSVCLCVSLALQRFHPEAC